MVRQMALVDMPEFTFDVNVLGGDVSAVPGVENWLRRTVYTSAIRCAAARRCVACRVKGMRPLNPYSSKPVPGVENWLRRTMYTSAIRCAAARRCGARTSACHAPCTRCPACSRQHLVMTP